MITKPYRLDSECMKWVEALSSCAIEGNQEAIEMLKLWDTDKDEFVKQLEERWIDDTN